MSWMNYIGKQKLVKVGLFTYEAHTFFGVKIGWKVQKGNQTILDLQILQVAELNATFMERVKEEWFHLTGNELNTEQWLWLDDSTRLEATKKAAEWFKTITLGVNHA